MDVGRLLLVQGECTVGTTGCAEVEVLCNPPLLPFSMAGNCEYGLEAYLSGLMELSSCLMGCYDGT